jgi:1,4-dihydroxy-2-naphthoate octaprenyltransferase
MTSNPWILAARPKTLGAAIAPVLVGSALAFYEGAFLWPAALLCLLFALLIQVATNFANDYYDARKGADTPERIGPTRAVAAGLISPVAMKRATFAVLALAFLVGLGLVPYGGWWLVGVGVASIVCALAYTAGPLPLAYVGLGDLFVLVFFGLVAVGFTYYVQAGSFTVDAWLAGAGCGLLATNILVVNNVRDRISDARAGKKTLAVRFGRTFSLLEFSLGNLFASLLPVYFSLVEGYAPIVMLAAPCYFLGALMRTRLLRARSREHYDAVLAGTAVQLWLWSALFATGLVLARFNEQLARA